MRIWAFSDLHLHPHEARADILPVIPEADLCVVAGDLVVGDIVGGIEWLSTNIRPYMPTVFIPGNHEFFGRAIDETLEAGRRSAEANGIDFLDDEAITFGETRIFGTTLWTDFSVFAGDDGALRGHAMAYAGSLLSDYEQIRPYLAKSERWTPVMSSAQHMSSRTKLETELATSTHPVVIVSHHGPHPRSLAADFARNRLAPSFVSDLSNIINRFQPAAWIHGHTHSKSDYQIGRTRIVCNALGHRFEKTGFDPEKVVEI